jgi:acetoin utilization deacetylase AcuC-like enzyme
MTAKRNERHTTNRTASVLPVGLDYLSSLKRKIVKRHQEEEEEEIEGKEEVIVVISQKNKISKKEQKTETTLRTHVDSNRINTQTFLRQISESTMKVFLAFDGRMALHQPLPDDDDHDNCNNDNPSDVSTDVDGEGDHFEIPHRIVAIYRRLIGLEGIDGYRRFLEVECKPASRETIELVHSSAHYDFMSSTALMNDNELRQLSVPNDLYYCRETFLAARLAVGGVVECINAVTDPILQRNYSNRAMAIVRPPGHHAGRDEAMGFCYFNNVAIGAKHAIATGRARRVFILDWDIHHGNGIQDVTIDDPQIFYLSIHRASFSKRPSKWFYPGTGRPSEVGVGDGEGTNLNIVFGEGGMGDEEYAAAFSHLVLPVLYNFKPDLILISCGLDAVQGDLIGDCGLSTEMYYTMTRSLLEAAPTTPIVAALEGGYNVQKSAECMEKVALALLDEPLDFEQRKKYVTWTSKVGIIGELALICFVWTIKKRGSYNSSSFILLFFSPSSRTFFLTNISIDSQSCHKRFISKRKKRVV